jgi:hypothetical protein
MTRAWQWMGAGLVACGVASGYAAAPDFDANPVTCNDPADASGVSVTVPAGADCAARASPRADGYVITGYSFNALIVPVFPPPVPPLPPMVVQADSERDFNNPVVQDLFVHIFGHTKVDVDGAPVLFFVNGTIDGEVVVTFSAVVSGHDNHMVWNSFGKKDDVPAGLRTLDMHKGFMQISPIQPSLVNVASLYEVHVTQVPEPASALMVLAGLLGLGVARRLA